MCQNCELGPSRRGVLGMLGTAAVAYALMGPAAAKNTKHAPKPQNAVSPDGALKLLTDGNARYVAGVARRHDFKHDREPLTHGQNPFAAILSCADSRIAPEYAFDVGLGDLFVCRVAGNFANDDVVASLEYALAELNTPLIMVLGHDACGAVRATIESLKDKVTLPGHLPSLVQAIAPAVKASETMRGNLLDNAIRQNVIQTAEKLRREAPIINGLEGKGKVRVVGAVYRLADGHIDLVA